MARLVTGRDKVISRYRCYHGSTGAAIVATGDWRRVPNEFARGHVHVFGPTLSIRSSGQRRRRRVSPRAAPPRARHPGRGTPVSRGHPARDHPGTAGVLMPPPGYLAGVREIADRYGIILILDEVRGRLRLHR